MTNPNQLTAEDIRQALARRSADPYISPYREAFVPGEPRPAAVLLPLLRQGDGWRLLFIRRSVVDGDHHSGQVAFPGGRQDPDDAGPEEAALREAREEIGLPPKRVKLLGRLEDMITITNYQVTPVVGEMDWPQDLHPAPTEVKRVFSIPLAWLANPSNRETQLRSAPGHSEQHPVIFFHEYAGEVLWGASARITMSFLGALGLA